MSVKILLNCANLPCPQPVIKLKKTIEEKSPVLVDVIVDNEPALENVTRFLSSKGYTYTYTQDGSLWKICGESTSASSCEALNDQQSMYPASSPVSGAAAQTKTLVLLLSPFVGVGSDELGKKLLKNFVSTLPELGTSLWRIIMLNGAVSLATEESIIVDELRSLEAAGVSILVCGTCLEHFKLMNKKVVGQTTNMLDVVTSLQLADKVIRM